MDLLVNIDVPDLQRAEAFYTRAFGLTVSRRFGDGGLELSGLPAKLYLLEKPEGSLGAGDDRRRYGRHWTPVHLDIIVQNLDAAFSKACAAGATADAEPRTHVWGKIAVLADPFGNGFCLIEFLNRGYDEIAPSTNP
jgi:predicted enzyme related to lactoylglutathione lyase